VVCTMSGLLTRKGLHGETAMLEKKHGYSRVDLARGSAGSRAEVAFKRLDCRL
jgi:hypothetical protein